MAKLQRDDAKMLWDEMGSDKSWSSLHHVLENHLEKSKGIEDSTVRRLLGLMDRLENSQEAFPDSAGKLADLLNERMTHEQGQQHAQQTQQRALQNQHHEQHRQHEKPHERAGTSQHQRQPHEEMRAQHNKADQQQSAKPLSGQGQAGKESDKAMTGQHQKMDNVRYQPQHMEFLYARGNWKSWDDLIMWLVNQAANDPAFEDADVEGLISDLDALRQAGVPFTHNFEHAIELVRRG